MGLNGTRWGNVNIKDFYRLNTCHSHMFAIIYIYIYQIYVTVPNYLYHKLLVLWLNWVGILKWHHGWVFAVSSSFWYVCHYICQSLFFPRSWVSSGWWPSVYPIAQHQWCPGRLGVAAASLWACPWPAAGWECLRCEPPRTGPQWQVRGERSGSISTQLHSVPIKGGSLDCMKTGWMHQLCHSV